MVPDALLMPNAGSLRIELGRDGSAPALERPGDLESQAGLVD
jgi:hypothetical protein